MAAKNLILAGSPAVNTAFADAATLAQITFGPSHGGHQRAKEQTAMRAAVWEAFRAQTALLGALAFDVRDDMTEAEMRAWLADFKALVAS